MNYLLISFISLVVISCGTEDVSNISAVAPEVQEEAVNRSGKYALIATGKQFRCDDGSTGMTDSFSKNVMVNIVGNEISLSAVPGDATKDTIGRMTGFIFDNSGYEGLVEPNGAFTMTQTATAYNVEEDVDLYFTYQMVGAITATGWTGTQTYTMHAFDYDLQCDYATSFSGSKQ